MGKKTSYNRKAANPSYLFVFVDLEDEYLTFSKQRKTRKARPRKVSQCLINSQRILSFARKNKMKIAHFRTSNKKPSIDQKSPPPKGHDHVRPRQDELVFVSKLPSCYSNSNFHSVLKRLDNPHVILIGLRQTQTCLSTATDAYHNYHDLTYIRDCSLTPALGNQNEVESNALVSDIINMYSRVLTTKEFLSQYKH